MLKRRRLLLRVGGALTLLLPLAIASCGRGPNPVDGSTEALSPEALAAAVRACQTLIDGQRYHEAEVVAAKLVQRAPMSWEVAELSARIAAAQGVAAMERGEEFAALGFRDVAAAEYIRAALIANDAALWQAAGVAASITENRSGAIDAFRRAAALDPTLLQPPLFEAQLHLAMEDLARAEEAIARAAALNPEEPFVLATQAEVARQRGDADEALRLVRAARRNAGDQPTFRATEARLLRQLGRPRDAVELLLALDDQAGAGDPAVVEELAQGWLALDEPARAAQTWEALLRRSSRHWRSGVRAADAWLRAGDVVRADAVLSEVEFVAQPHPEISAMRQRVVGGSP